LASRDASFEQAPSGCGVTFENVEKRFGAFAALRGVSFEIRAGEFVALLGPNGAGKTTVLRIAALLAAPTRGKVSFTAGLGEGAAPGRTSHKANIGLAGHSSFLYEDLTAVENLTLAAELYGLDKAKDRAASALHDCGLSSRSGSQVRTFSRGMRQRLTIARSILHRPRLLLLDEPAAGLDRQGLAWFSMRLASFRDRGATVIMSTHARNESLDLATRAVSLVAGEVREDSGTGGDPGRLLAALRAGA
jgi:ABC-type multidrug transport system ATPase subunit